MLGHLGINVPDLAQAKAYYDVVMPLLDYETFLSGEDALAFMPAAGKRGTYLFVYQAQSGAPYSRHETGLQHLAFAVPSRTAVGEVHRCVLGLGSQVLHAPQEFPQYPPPYFATFWLDPFGFMLEAVCHREQP
jgi:catechol 2,3-dioxygenase-like lactoylglutathione lyase family enzyme